MAQNCFGTNGRECDSKYLLNVLIWPWPLSKVGCLCGSHSCSITSRASSVQEASPADPIFHRILHLQDRLHLVLTHWWGGKQTQLDWYTALAWWHKECQWGLRHGLQLVDITSLWLFGLNIGWDCLSCNGFWSNATSGNFSHFSETNDSPLVQP